MRLGGDSLHAAALASRIWQEVGAAPSVAGVLTEGTPERIAELLARERDAAQMPPIPIGGMPAPITDSQTHFLLAEELGRGEESVIFAGFEVEGLLDVEAFDRALLDVIARHDVLHARYLDGPEGPQLERAPVPGRMELVALGSGPLKDLAGLATARLDLLQGRPVGVAIDAGEEQSMLCVAMHHAALDGESEDIFLRDLSTAYSARVGPGQAGMAGLPPEFTAYIRWHRSLVESVAEREERFWSEELRAVEPLPWSHGSGPEQGSHRRMPLDLGVGSLQRLEASAAEQGMTPHGLALADFFVALGETSGADDFAVGTSVSGRRHPAFDDTIGCFLNSIAVCPGSLAGSDAAAARSKVWEALRRALANQDLPFARVARMWDCDQAVSHPVFQVFFEFQRAPANLQLAGCKVNRAPLEHLGGTLFDIYLELVLAPDQRTLSGSLITRDSVNIADVRTLADKLAGLLDCAPGRVEQRYSAAKGSR
jgi:hypothetical protein